MLRVFDMKNSLILVHQICNYYIHISSISTFDIFASDSTIENVIYLFYMVWSINVSGLSVSFIEAPKGEYILVMCIYSLYTNRIRIRCSDFIHVLMIDITCRGFLLADLVAFIGNIDVVFGSVDR